MAQQSTWQPLDSSRSQYRIFLLDPNDDFNEPPSGRLLVVSTSDDVDYDAISYAWSEAGDSRPVYINGQRHLVATSLETNFKYARLTNKCVALWCDTICINQIDNDEKSSQIQMMADIFSRASSVRVFFNPDSVQSAWVARAVNVILDTLPYPELVEAVVGHQSFTSLHLQYALGLNFDTWFKRTWVLQEVILAKRVSFHYEDKSFKLEQLYEFILKAFSYRTHCRKHASWSRLEEMSLFDLKDNIMLIYNAREDFGIAATPAKTNPFWLALSRIFFEVRKRQVTDPKDRVYGLLALVSRAFGTTLITPDYQVSLRSILVNFAFEFIKESRSLILLSQTAQPTNSVTSLPSWVPDLSSRYNFSTESHRVSLDNSFNASDSKRFEVARSGPHDPYDCIRLKGLLVDTITHTGAINDNRAETRGQWHVQPLRDWEHQCLSVFPNALSKKYLADSPYSVWSAFCRTLINSREVVPPHPGMEYVHSLVAELDAHSNTDSNLQPLSPSAATMRASISKRRFFITQKGYVGLGTPYAQVGDNVVILAGGNVPFILRQLPASRMFYDYLDPLELMDIADKVYAFVGDCYVEGIMHGEFVQQASENGFQDLWLL